jgi:DDE superfamily endonuclease
MGILTINIDSRKRYRIMEDSIMPAIVEFPTVVKEALDEFGDHFKNEPERKHFAEYLTGLMIANKKNVSAINREFAITTDQSCLNRWLTEVDWDEEALNRERLEWLQQQEDTRYSPQGVIAIDNVLIDHFGKWIEDAGYFWDHAEQRHKIAHDYIIVNYVCTSGKHYPMEFYRFVKKEHCDERDIEFVDHNQFVRWLIDWVVEKDIPGAFTFDSYFTCAENLNHLHAHDRAYVGDLKFNRKILFKGQELKAEELAGQISPDDRKPLMLNGSRQYYFTKTIRLPGVDHKVRITLLWGKRKDKKAKKILVCNRPHWEVSRILKVYRCRWRGTECFHRDGKQHLGMGDCQLRKGRGQTRHMYMVFLAHSVLMRQLRQGRAREWAQERLTTIGQACMSVLRQTLSDTISWVIERIEDDGWNFQKVKVQLELP